MKNIGVSTNDISHISRIYKILGSEKFVVDRARTATEI